MRNYAVAGALGVFHNAIKAAKESEMSDLRAELDATCRCVYPDKCSCRAVTLQTYTLEIVGPEDRLALLILKSAVRYQEMIREAEENLTDLLPEGYSARISEWDAEEETPNE